MAIRIISPTDAAAPCCKAAEVFQTLYEQVTGTRLPLESTDDGFAALAGRLSPQQVEQERLRLEQRFLQTPLHTLQPAHPADPQTVLRQAAGAVEALETVWQLPSEGAKL